jgi:hypothetical protein
MFRNSRLSVLVVLVLLLHIQSWCWYFSSSSVIVSSGSWVRMQGLWTTICLITGSASSPTYCQPSTFAGFVYWKFALSSAPFFSSLSSAVAFWPSTFPGFLYWKFPLVQCAQSTSLLCCIFLFSSLFIIQFFYFCRAGVSLSRVLCLYIRGIAVGIPHAAYLLICWYASLKQGWSWRLVAPPVSPCNVEWRSLVWAGGLQVSEFCFFLVFLFCQVWLHHLSKIFDLWSPHYLLPPSSNYLGSLESEIWKLFTSRGFF